MLTRRFIYVADQHPRWWSAIGYAVLILAGMLLSQADASPWIAGAGVLALALVGTAALERARRLPLERAQRAAETARRERELDLQCDRSDDLR